MTRKFRAEVEDEMQSLCQCGGIGQDNVHISRHKAAKEAEAETNLGRKTSICQEGGERERRISATGVLETSHVFSVSSRADTVGKDSQKP